MNHIEESRLEELRIRSPRVRLPPRRVVWSILAVVILYIGPCGVGYSSVCSECGARCWTYRRELSFVPIPYLVTWSTRESPLSEAAKRLELVGKHRHRWLFAHGSGNGAICMIGDGRFLGAALESRNFIALLESVSRFEGADAAKNWLRRGLTPEQTHRLTFFLEMSGFPETPFGTAKEYTEWKDREEQYSWALDPGVRGQ